MAPVLDAILTGIATTLSNIYALAIYLRAQTRIGSATDGFLDLIAFEFFGTFLKRYPDDTDVSFRTRILQFLLMPRLTRAGISAMLTALTGRTPGILAQWNPQDCGGWDFGIMGWDRAGCWGAIQPNQLTIVAYRPTGVFGIAPQAGWADGSTIYQGNELFGSLGQFSLGQLQTAFVPTPGAWDDGTGTVGGAVSWVSPASISGDVTDALIQKYVAAWVAAGLNYQLSISN
ncbi:hypothetical protein [Bradyrhizobium sp.]|uniref:hypothetical protein n=1 Tax=Bradyrhizobium sp. TaxID=376 RepID=UPI001EB7C2D5|nr:hypothetical protein [Bradyrhizobium sp.]MBV9984494.1 hypothetical protein [Bradyrhizobium sp.]